jgi:FMN phosphatase YigB (HAD superfamily)
MGVDVRDVLAREGLLPLLDAVVLSCEAGAVKPEPAIFRTALEALDADPARTLMVGDNAHDDGGAAALGVRTLILPRTPDRRHKGLDAVLRLAGVPR